MQQWRLLPSPPRLSFLRDEDDGGDAGDGDEARPCEDDEVRPAGVTRTRPRGGGALAVEDEHEGQATHRRGHARRGDEVRTGEDAALHSDEDNDEEVRVTRTMPRVGGALASKNGEEGGGRRLKGG
jgi:hypothetical protein